MRHNGRTPLRASTFPVHHLDLRIDGPQLVVCPHCHAWRSLRRSILMPHRRRDERGNPTAERCPGSAQRITLDLTPEEWAADLMKGREQTAAVKSNSAVPRPKVPATVSGSSTGRYLQSSLAKHREDCGPCQSSRGCDTERGLRQLAIDYTRRPQTSD